MWAKTRGSDGVESMLGFLRPCVHCDMMRKYRDWQGKLAPLYIEESVSLRVLTKSRKVSLLWHHKTIGSVGN